MDSNGIEYVIKLGSYSGANNRLVYQATTGDGLLIYKPVSDRPFSLGHEGSKVFYIDMDGMGCVLRIGDKLHGYEIVDMVGVTSTMVYMKPIVAKCKKLVLAIDFDHTIAEVDDYTCWEKPVIQGLIVGAKEYINRLHQDGHTIIINTARESANLAKAIEFLNENGVEYDFVNCNTPKHIAFMKRDSRKVVADVYIDDKNIGGIPTWDEIYNTVTELSKK